ncbi:MAG: DNA polymerase III subunit alpha [Alphaproteobacteria bacterium 13_1_20CM_4_65_11]|nr:MAG: DNA polymerase III subunit alpha [Alphaproteobacteria bacterium 13_1_20CM_4_65_11]
MPLADFIHLRVHSAYSLSAGAIKTKELVQLCRGEAMPAVAITDSGNLFGALEFATACSEAGIQPIIGCEIALAPNGGGRNGRAANGNGQAHAPNGHGERDRIVLLVQNEAGYRNLLSLVSRAFLDGEAGGEPSVALADLANESDGLICLAGGAGGPVGRPLAEGQAEAAEAALLTLKDIFPGRLYIEVQRHGLPEELRSEAGLVDLAYAHDLPLVATNDAYFPDRDFYEAHDALMCIAQGRIVADDDRRRLTPEHFFRPAEEMRALFADLPEACDNTVVIARRCAFIPQARKPILPAFPLPAGQDEVSALRAAARGGLASRHAGPAFAAADDEVLRPYRERLEFELDMIVKTGFAGYFLIVADFIQWAKRQDIPVGPGRGSGAGSVVAWALTITDLDPLRFGLLFERFLNPERVSMPDFDIDFCQDRRDEVIRYVQQKYGRDRVAQIITFGKLQARAVLRDVGRVLAMPYGQVDRIAKLVPYNPAHPVSLEKAIWSEPQLQAARDSDEAVARLLTTALRLEGLYRHASTHAAGVVIGDRPLRELVPLYRDPRSDMPVTQFNMKWVELAGLVKFDFLGLKTLTVLARCLDLLAARGIDLDLANLPFDDRPAYELLARGDTVGVFQVEGAGVRDMLKKLRPDRFEDIIAVVSLYRPGPMENIPRYIAVKHGEEKPDYLHPALEEILKETHGIMIYQEQVMQIAQVLAGYTLGGADLLRRAMGKKIQSEMDAQRKTFVEGAVARGVAPGKAEQIFDQMAKFAGYGFNKSHAAAYALVAYQTAYLKANYPVEFLAASMTLDLGNTDKLNHFRQELGRLGIALLPPDINRSEVAFSVETDPKTGKPAIRYALAAVKGVGEQAMSELVAERAAHGPYKDLFDFARRLDTKSFNRRQFENLVKAGAFECLNPNRAQSFSAAELLLRQASRAAEERVTKQENLFAAVDSGFAARPSLPVVADWPSVERLQNEFEAIGFYLSSPPLDPYAKSLERAGVLRWVDLPAALAANGSSRFRLGGIVIGKKERTSARGNRFAFVQLSDTSGAFEVTTFSEALAQARGLLEGGQPLIVTVDVRREDESLRLTVQKIEPLDTIVAQAAAGLRIFVAEAEALPRLKSVISREAGGRGRVTVVLDLPSREIEVALPGGFRIDPKIRAAVKSLPGIIDVHEI